MHPRQVSSSAPFALTDPKQVQEFKEAFAMIDEDQDGKISAQDLSSTLASLGMDHSDTTVNNMLKSARAQGRPIGIPLPTWLSLWSEKMGITDEEKEILGAFECFDDDDEGRVKISDLREALETTGDRMSRDQVDQLIRGRFMDNEGYFRYRDFTAFLKHGDIQQGKEAARV